MEIPNGSPPNGKPPETCGCPGPSRRLCDMCETDGRTFLASSLGCLEQHLASVHADRAQETSLERARDAARELNRSLVDPAGDDTTHRQHVSELIGRLPRGGELCVLGAGNGSDLDFERLSAWFNAIHLVDLDAEALESARDRQGATIRTKIVLHSEVDLSGMIDHLDDWGEAFPDRAELGRSAVAAAQAVVRGLGQSFPATVSNCVLSQLAAPFQRAWVTSRANWGDLLSTLSSVHLATMAGSTRAGGRGLLLFDVASSKTAPRLGALRRYAPGELDAFVAREREAGDLHLRPEPRQVYMQLSSPGMRRVVSEPELGAPWLRQRGEHIELLYSVEFAHPANL